MSSEGSVANAIIFGGLHKLRTTEVVQTIRTNPALLVLAATNGRLVQLPPEIVEDETLLRSARNIPNRQETSVLQLACEMSGEAAIPAKYLQYPDILKPCTINGKHSILRTLATNGRLRARGALQLTPEDWLSPSPAESNLRCVLKHDGNAPFVLELLTDSKLTPIGKHCRGSEIEAPWDCELGPEVLAHLVRLLHPPLLRSADFISANVRELTKTHAERVCDATWADAWLSPIGKKSGLFRALELSIVPPLHVPTTSYPTCRRLLDYCIATFEQENNTHSATLAKALGKKLAKDQITNQLPKTRLTI